MFARHINSLLRLACFLGFLSLALLAGSCGHTEASPSPVAMDAVMKTIHDCGRDHHGLLIPGSSAKPDESADLYTAHISNLMVHADFAQLERIAQQNRVEKGRLLGGFGRYLNSTTVLECRFLWEN